MTHGIGSLFVVLWVGWIDDGFFVTRFFLLARCFASSLPLLGNMSAHSPNALFNADNIVMRASSLKTRGISVPEY